MKEEFDDLDSTPAFDIKAFLFKALSYWKLFILCVGIGVFVVYQQNIRKQQSYRLLTKISIEDDKNPLFTSSTNLTFNYGGVSGKVQTLINTLQSRSLHEQVVSNLQFYVTYLKQSRFRKDDVYKEVPFKFVIDTSAFQLSNIPAKITFLGDNEAELELNFESNVAYAQKYSNFKVKTIAVPIGVITKHFRLGEVIDLPYLKGRIDLLEDEFVKPGDSYFLQFSNFDAVVAQYRGRLAVNNPRNSAIINLSMVDNNTKKIEDYLNETVRVVTKEQLARKNQFVTNTIKFIDSQLSRVKDSLTGNADALNAYRSKNGIYSLDQESELLSSKLADFELQRDEINRKKEYYSSLKSYLQTSQSFTDLPAPSVAGIDDGNILSNISKINSLSVQKAKYEATVKPGASIFDDLNSQIESIKLVLLENISSTTNGINRDFNSINSKILSVKGQFSKLPKDQQNLLDIERQYLLNEKTYNLFLSKRGEADIIKSATVSDILWIDSAKNTGAQPIDLKLSSRYMFALFGGILPPLLLAFLVTFFDTKIHSPQSLEGLSVIPLLGVVGKNVLDNNLAVHRKPKSSVAESFRAIRSSLQYMYKQHDADSTKTVMITSSVSGEGKTFCSINIATVFALSGKKTVLVGLDLRKPKIFGDFNIQNDIGAVNYLIGQKNLKEVTQATKVENLDVITSGPIPPNPSELLISKKMTALMEELKSKYDYIILDTPPIGLVADAIELLRYSDASLYVVRQDYSKKEMLTLINDKYKKGEVKNISFLYNGYDQKGKYGYGYGNYANGYHEEVKSKVSFIERLISFFNPFK
jgi:capsular exopolysaccharide synthesis family protein